MGYSSGGARIIPKPPRKVSRSRTVTGRWAGTVSSSGPSRRRKYRPAGQLGQQPVDWLVEGEHAVLDEEQRGRPP